MVFVANPLAHNAQLEVMQGGRTAKVEGNTNTQRLLPFITVGVMEGNHVSKGKVWWRVNDEESTDWAFHAGQ